MKRILTTVIVVALVLAGCLTIFAACNSVDSDHTIYFYSSQGDNLQVITDQAIAAFEAKYPGWTVEHSQPGGYDEVREKIKQDFQAGNQPDLAYCYADHVAMYMTYGGVVDMSKYLLSDEDFTYTYTDEVTGEELTMTVEHVGYTAEEVAKFVPGYLEEGYATNFSDYEEYGFTSTSMLTLPFVKSTELMYVNKSALDACGLEVATTWDEIWEQSAIIKQRYPSATPLAYDSEANWFITMCEQNGWGYTSASGEHYLFNNENTRAWLEELNGYYDKNYVTTKEDYNGAYTSALFVQGADDGGAIYCIGSSGGASHQDPSGKFNFEIHPIPGSVRDDGTVDYSCISQGPSLVMLTGANGVSNPTEKQMMTWLFVKELLDPTFQAAFSIASGYNPMRTDVYTDVPKYVSHLEGTSATARAAKLAVELTDRFFTSPAFDGSSDARDQVGNALLLAMKGRDPAKALREAYDNCPHA